jgi:hypothetical protein
MRRRHRELRPVKTFLLTSRRSTRLVPADFALVFGEEDALDTQILTLISAARSTWKLRFVIDLNRFIERSKWNFWQVGHRQIISQPHLFERYHQERSSLSAGL